ncbi:hypothetical protein C7212DRAFT_365800 [Tuber magnatum]|uniref:Uncharacterized protein n=1 Tax=Tuber magnatum TaxID=42249 RepID=A0A317SG51_9PEZI|nr:hypothetical protein C7212DRAFT_365800 [Tuber magnatum]
MLLLEQCQQVKLYARSENVFAPDTVLGAAQYSTSTAPFRWVGINEAEFFPAPARCCAKAMIPRTRTQTGDGYEGVMGRDNSNLRAILRYPSFRYLVHRNAFGGDSEVVLALLGSALGSTPGSTLGSILISFHGIPVSPEDPPLGTLHHTVQGGGRKWCNTIPFKPSSRINIRVKGIQRMINPENLEQQQSLMKKKQRFEQETTRDNWIRIIAPREIAEWSFRKMVAKSEGKTGLKGVLPTTSKQEELQSSKSLI